MSEMNDGKMTYRQYRFKFYLNMNHFIVTDGKPGVVHPHTWEISASVAALNGTDRLMFSDLEKIVKDELAPYQNRLMNEVHPFDVVDPTVENAAKYFFRGIQDKIIMKGWALLMLEISETPVRSYIINAFLNEDDIWDEWYERVTKHNEAIAMGRKEDDVDDGLIMLTGRDLEL